MKTEQQILKRYTKALKSLAEEKGKVGHDYDFNAVCSLYSEIRLLEWILGIKG